MRLIFVVLVSSILAVFPPAEFVWPTGGPVAILGAFAPPAVPWGVGHRGVDLEFPAGAIVRAAGDGVVVYAGNLAGRGVVSIEHSGGLRTTYEPVSASVAAGEVVMAGSPIGELQAGHCPEGCLHFGARRGPKEYVDPLSLFADVQVRLKPLGGLKRAGAPG